MPIYAYGCSSCGLQKDVMQKISEEPLRICPECGKATFVKQLTAAGFQLKGSGYYVTDFKGGPRQSDSGRPDSAKADVKSGAKPDPAPAASAPSSAVANGTVQ